MLGGWESRQLGPLHPFGRGRPRWPAPAWNNATRCCRGSRPGP